MDPMIIDEGRKFVTQHPQAKVLIVATFLAVIWVIPITGILAFIYSVKHKYPIWFRVFAAASFALSLWAVINFTKEYLSN